jgi:hypothetical protein
MGFNGNLVDENAKVLDEHQIVKRGKMEEYKGSPKQERLYEVVNLESLLRSSLVDLRIMDRNLSGIQEDIRKAEDTIRSIEQGLYNLRASLSKGR